MSKLKIIVIMWCLNFLFWCVSGLTNDYSREYELWFESFAKAAFFAFSLSKLCLSTIMLFLLFGPEYEDKEEVE